MTAYCSSADVYRYGPPPGALANPARGPVSVAIATDVLTLDEHAFELDDLLLFRAESGGTLPAELVAGTTYYAIVLTGATFQVAATAGGAAINLTTTGSNMVVISQLPISRLIAFESAIVDEQLPQHVVPIASGSVPESVRGVVAMRVAAMLMQRTRSGTAQEIADLRTEAAKHYKRWTTNAIRGAVVPAAAGLATVAITTATDPRGWIPTGGRL